MLRIGHIIYSNCFPVHARLLAGRPHPGVELVRGVPSELNRGLAESRIDLAPCSSIEYARHADRYRVVPDFTIASDGPVRSILLETTGPVEALDGRTVALPTASATSVVLLRLLLETRAGITPCYQSFDQRSEDPFAAGAEAALWIGDDALHRSAATDRPLLDLGQAWHDWTGLPFAFAVWQTSAGTGRDRELADAHGLLLESLAFFHERAEMLAREYAAHFGVDAAVLLDYWHSLEYRLDDRVIRGLSRFYQLAAEIGETPAVPQIRWTPRATAKLETR